MNNPMKQEFDGKSNYIKETIAFAQHVSQNYSIIPTHPDLYVKNGAGLLIHGSKFHYDLMATDHGQTIHKIYGDYKLLQPNE